MKKFLSMFLALTLALTLAVPALAVDKDSPDYLAGFQDGYDTGWIEGYDEGYADGSGEVSSEYYKGYQDGWDADYDKGCEAGEADAARNTYEEKTVSPVREDCSECTYEDGYADGSADGFASGYEDGFYSVTGLWGWQVQELMDKGGVPAQVNVLFDDACIDFPDAAPKVVHGRTMIPIRAVSEGMDKIVDWDEDAQTVTVCEKDVDASVLFTIGSQTAAVYRGEEKSEITMDCAPYLDNDRTMIPVRFLSEALGYTVLWDEQYQTVVIVDAPAVAGAIDAGFTRFNEMAAQQAEVNTLGDCFQADCALNGTLTLYDETGKATRHKVGMDLTLSTDSRSLRLDATLDLKSILEALAAEPDLLTEDADISLQDLLSIDWSAITATFLMDESGHCWLNIPALNSLQDADEDAWFDLTDESSTASLDLNLSDLLSLPEDSSVGQVLVAMCSSDADSFHFYQTLNNYATLLEAFYGDSTAKGSSTSCTWTLNGSALLESIGFSQEMLADLGWEKVNLSGKMTLNNKGNSSFQYDLRMVSDWFSTVTGSLSGSGTADSTKVKLSAAMADLFDLNLTLTCTVKPLDTLPAFVPPAGAEILPLEDTADVPVDDQGQE